jgi:RsiW-degrading membrane proteinase PrsW (M82 family)/ribosomal protein S27E
MEKLAVRCSGCQKKLLFQEKQRGRRVSCPVCATTVVLDTPATSPVKSGLTAIEDPFADLADPSANQTGTESASPNNDARSTAASRRKKPKTDRAGDDQAKEQGSADSERLQDSEIDYGGSGEPYIDELGLGEISELRSDDWAEPLALPPVQKRLIRKKKTSPTTPDTDKSTPARSSSIQASDGFEDTRPPSFRRRLSYVVYFLTLLPLGLMILLPKADEQNTQMVEAEQQAENEGDPFVAPNDDQPDDPAAADDDVGPAIDEEMDDDAAFDEQQFDVDGFLRSLPEQRIPGALLSRDSWFHWLFAASSGVVFAFLFLGLFRSYMHAMGGAVVAGVFTATIGIILLLGLQLAAFASAGIGLRGFGRRVGILTLIFLVVKAIGFSYRCALEPGAGFVSSFMGFTLGVGICEEVCKILPVIVYMATATNVSWQSSCLVGLASGVGFGVSEGIMYSSTYYNGISGGDIYLVRFISCVALHSVWTGAGAVLLYFNQENLHSDWSDIIMILALTLGVPIILHGLYDTLLKQNMPAMALVTAVMSVAWLISVVEKQTLSEAV